MRRSTAERAAASIRRTLSMRQPAPPLAVTPQPESLRARFPLRRGRHASREGALCTMELVAWLAGEKHSDEPACACPVLGALVRTTNDLILDHATRERVLRPLAPRLVHSRGDDALGARRAWIAADAVARFLAPLLLDRLEERRAADELRSLPRIEDRAGAAVAAAVLGRRGRCLRAATWTLRQAAEGRPGVLWISGVAHAALRSDAIAAVRRIAEDMLELRVAAR